MIAINPTPKSDFSVMTWNIWHGGREDGEKVGPQKVVWGISFISIKNIQISDQENLSQATLEEWIKNEFN